MGSSAPLAVSPTVSAVQAAARDLDELLSGIAGLLSDLIDGSQVDEPPGSPTLESSGRFWHLWHNLKQRHGEQQLSVALLALAKSGA